MPLPLLGLAAGIGKALVVGTAKAAAVGAKVGTKAAVSSGKFFAKGGASLARGGARVARQGGRQVVKGAKFFKKKVGGVKRKGGEISKKLKENATNLRDSLKKGNKNQDKLRAKGTERKKKKESIEKKQGKEKELESKKSTSGSKNILSGLAKSPLNILNKLFGLGGLLLGGILVNAAQGLIDKGKKFMEDNKELFDTIGNFLNGVKDAVVGLLDSFTGPYAEEGSLDWLGKFDDLGNLQSGLFKDIEKSFDVLGGLVNDIDKALGGEGKIGNALISDKKILAEKGGKEGVLNQTTGEFQERPFTKEERQRYDRVRSGAEPLEGGNGQISEGKSTSSPITTTSSGLYGLVNPTPNTNILENKGGYAADTGLDIIGKTGDPIVSPVSGILEYAERGHTAQMGQDSDPTKPGIQDQLSFRIRLNSPFTFDGKKVNFVYGTHLSTLDSAVANKFDIPIKAGQRLGTMGVANNVPHLHIGFLEDRLQTGFLNFKEVRRLLSGQSSNESKPGAAGLLKGVTKDERNKQARAINQPMDDEGEETIFIQRVNTIQYVPFPVTT